MGFNYANMAATALAQINDKGRSVTLRYVTQGTYNPATDGIAGASEADVSVKAVIRFYTQKEQIETMIMEGDKEALIASSGITAPLVDDVIVDGDEFKILRVEEVKPGDTALLYRLQIRR